ncbi:MAG: DNA internalization-related competence protein ComEC/Rec2 [Gammaproteobacteria bacterium]|jgi:competence protein ComEC
MPQHAIAILAGSLLALFGNELADRFWSAYLPLLLLLYRYCPGHRLLLIAAAAYLWSAAWFHHHLDHRLIEAYDNRVTVVRGVVEDLPVVESGRVVFYLEVLEIDAYPSPLPRRIRLAWYQRDIRPRPGENWRLAVKLKQPRGLSNPGGFDFEAWQFSRGIDARGYVVDSPVNSRLAAAGSLDPHRWRERLAAALDAHCRDCEHAGLIKALAIGFRADIPQRQRQVLQQTATAHLLAISGLHVGMVAMLAFAVGRLLWRLGLYRGPLARPRLVALLVMLAATGYAAMAGFSLPTLRSLIMLLAILLSTMTKNRVNLLQSLAIAVTVIATGDPRSLLSSSFWLSSGALLVIAFVQFRVPGSLPRWRQLLTLQLYFTLLFTPVGMLLFGQLSPASLPANLVAIPAVSFVLLPAVLAGSLLAVSGLPGAGWLLQIADRGLGWLLGYLDWLLQQGLGAVSVAYPTVLLLVLLLLLGWLLLPRSLPGRRGALLAALLLLGWQPSRPAFGEFRVRVLDVGMGTSVLVLTRNHSLVYDLGPGGRGGTSAADWALLPAILRYRIGMPDLAVVSHVDRDHSGGLNAFIDAYPGTALLSGTPRELADRFELSAPVPSCHERPDWRWDGVEFSFLGAPAGDETNNRSCVLLIDGGRRVLLPGDIESRRESSLVAEYGDRLAADVLLAPHHGSATSSTGDFLDRVNPDYAIFTLSRGNRWGFPAPGVIERYRRRGVRLFDSARDGAISVFGGPEELRIEVRRGTPRRIWRRW